MNENQIRIEQLLKTLRYWIGGAQTSLREDCKDSSQARLEVAKTVIDQLEQELINDRRT